MTSRAIAILYKGKQIFPQSYLIAANLGSALAQAERYSEGIAELERALACSRRPRSCSTTSAPSMRRRTSTPVRSTSGTAPSVSIPGNPESGRPSKRRVRTCSNPLYARRA